MPLLTSPISGEPMRQINRYGIEIDVCPTTGGVWLDKGELEKLMAFIREAAAEEQANYAPPPQAQRAVYQEPRREERYEDRRYERDSYKHSGHGKYPYKKKSKFGDLLDIFDF